MKNNQEHGTFKKIVNITKQKHKMNKTIEFKFTQKIKKKKRGTEKQNHNRHQQTYRKTKTSKTIKESYKIRNIK